MRRLALARLEGDVEDLVRVRALLLRAVREVRFDAMDRDAIVRERENIIDALLCRVDLALECAPQLDQFRVALEVARDAERPRRLADLVVNERGDRRCIGAVRVVAEVIERVEHATAHERIRELEVSAQRVDRHGAADEPVDIDESAQHVAAHVGAKPRRDERERRLASCRERGRRGLCEVRIGQVGEQLVGQRRAAEPARSGDGGTLHDEARIAEQRADDRDLAVLAARRAASTRSPTTSLAA